MNLRPSRPIALVGLMGAGKSSVSRILGERLALPVVDVDEIIATQAGCSIPELFERLGEAAFRAHEREVLARSVEGEVGVLSLGGGVVLDPGNRRLLAARCRTVWLEVEPDEAARRVAAGAERRPLLAGGPPAQRLASLLAERAPLYAQVAEVRVATDRRTPGEVASAVLAALQTTLE